MVQSPDVRTREGHAVEIKSPPIQPPQRTRHGEPVCPDCGKIQRFCRCAESED